MITCQWMQMIYSYERVMSILSWRRATYPGGERGIKMGESTPALLEPCVHLLHTHAKSCSMTPPFSIPIRNCSSHTKVTMLSCQVLPRVQLYLWPPVGAYKVWPIMLSCAYNQCCTCRSYTLHWLSHASVTWSSLREECGLYTSIWDLFWARGYRHMNLYPPPLPAWEVLDDIPHCLLYRQEGYIPSNYVTEAEDSIEMYEWVCLCSQHTVFPDEWNIMYTFLYFQ